jgi:hypothetical protein
MAFTPNSKVYLLDTPLNNKNTRHFKTLEEQQDYFFSRQKHTFVEVEYLGVSDSMCVNEHVDSLRDSNYVMYQNTNYGEKWFYAYITKMDYVSPNATEIYIETDVYQTWLFEGELKQSFVVREHVADDTIGSHLVDEQLETGEYIFDEYYPSGELGENYNILAVSDNSPLGNTETIGNLYTNIVTGLTYFPFKNTLIGIAWLKSVIEIYAVAKKVDAIVMIFTVPKVLLGDWDEPLGTPLTTGLTYGINLFTDSKKYTDLNGYTPKNNKMHTYPYKFLQISNATGQAGTYRYEDFDVSGEPTQLSFAVTGAVMPNPKVLLSPCNYKGATLSYEHGLMLDGYPLGSWNSDAWTAWFAQNSGGMGVTLAGSALAIGAGIATGNLLAVGGGALGVASQMSQMYQASIQPDQSKGHFGGGSLRYAENSLDFYFAHMTIKAEFAKRIDNYFTMYGYKVNTLKVPETTSRSRWNYIQTIDVNIEGAIPAEDMKKLKSIYDNGVTLWHTSDNFLDYSLTNSIV